MTTRRMSLGAGAAALTTLAVCSSQSGEGTDGLTLWVHNRGNKEEFNVVDSTVKSFNAASPNTPITMRSFPQESYNDVIASAAVSGSLSGILDLGDPIMSSQAWAGYLSPLTISQDLQGKIVGSAKGVWDNKLCSVGPYDTSLCSLGRKSAFDKAGVTIPTVSKPQTKDKFMDTLDKLSRLDSLSYATDMPMWDAAE